MSIDNLCCTYLCIAVTAKQWPVIEAFWPLREEWTRVFFPRGALLLLLAGARQSLIDLFHHLHAQRGFHGIFDLHTVEAEVPALCFASDIYSAQLAHLTSAKIVAAMTARNVAKHVG